MDATINLNHINKIPGKYKSRLQITLTALNAYHGAQ
jgi:hypothetical protein